MFNFIKDIPYLPSLYWNRNNFEKTLNLLKKNGQLLQYSFSKWKSNKIVVLNAIKQNPLALKYASVSLRNDPELTQIVLEKNIDAFDILGDTIKNDKNFILGQVKKNGLLLQKIEGTLFNDWEIALEAISENEYAIPYTTPNFYHKIMEQKKIQASSVTEAAKELLNQLRIKNELDSMQNLIENKTNKFVNKIL